MKAIYKPALAGLVSIVLGVAIAWNALGQQKGENESADIAKVKAASQAFYTAFSGSDAAAMDKVWAQESYIVYVGPRSKTIAVASTPPGRSGLPYLRTSRYAIFLSRLQASGRMARLRGKWAPKRRRSPPRRVNC